MHETIALSLFAKPHSLKVGLAVYELQPIAHNPQTTRYLMQGSAYMRPQRYCLQRLNYNTDS